MFVFFCLGCRINPYGLVQIVEVIVEHIADKTEAVAFLDKFKDKVKICDEAVWYLQASGFKSKQFCL